MSSPYGLQEVYASPDAKLDIVFLHGLRGDSKGTWTKDGCLWPEELLPKDVPESRIFLFGYDTGITHRDQSQVTQSEIHSDANDFCAKLAAERSRSSTENRPIVIIAHSLGGLVAAQTLVHGELGHGESTAKSVTQNIRGMIFLGTPFRGSTSARPAEIVRKVLQVFGVSTQEQTLRLLLADSERLDELTRAFAQVLNKRRTSSESADKIEAFFFYETLKTKGRLIVESDSAQLPGCGDAAPIRANHLDICKFKTDKDEGYGSIVAAIRKAMIPRDPAATTKGAKTFNILGKAVNVAGEDINIGTQNFNNF
ncbi:Alpha/Beta hydrolase protein [Xylaria flabelliformis]|nr:Alpha/Beta hydrolase protein [Xylaria flabelliformis]